MGKGFVTGVIVGVVGYWAVKKFVAKQPMGPRGYVILFGGLLALTGYLLLWDGILFIEGFSGPGRSGPGIMDLLLPSRLAALNQTWQAGAPGGATASSEIGVGAPLGQNPTQPVGPGNPAANLPSTPSAPLGPAGSKPL